MAFVPDGKIMIFDGKRVHACRFDLAEVPTIERLRQLFWDLHAQYVCEPDYLFLSEQDHSTLEYAIKDDPVIMRKMPMPPMKGPLPRDYFVNTAITQFCTPRYKFWDNTFCVVTLSDLPSGSVMVGFSA